MVKRSAVIFTIVLLFILMGNQISYAAYHGESETIGNRISIMGQQSSHKVKFDLAGGSWIEGFCPPTSRRLNEELILPGKDMVIREGFQFAGWYTEADYSGDVQTVCPMDQQADITYYAKWNGGNAILLPGTKFNNIIKRLANGVSVAYDDDESQVRGIQWAESVPDGKETSVVTTDTSASRILAYYDEANGVINLVNEDNADVYMNEDSSYMFSGLTKLTYLDLSQYMIEYVTNVEYMFYRCLELERVQMQKINTGKLITLKAMFAYCWKLVEMDLGDWNVENVTNMSSIFLQCKSMVSVNLEGWNPINTLEMDSTFGTCSSLKSLDIANWKTEKLQSSTYMFSGCSALKTLDLSGWDTRKLSTIRRMFAECTQLKTLDLSGWNTENVTIMGNVFQNTNRLSELHIEQFDMSAATNKTAMFSKAASISKSCTIYCTEETESALLSGTSMTASYFTFVHTEKPAMLLFTEVRTESGSNAVRIEYEAASGSNASRAEYEMASRSNAKRKAGA